MNFINLTFFISCFGVHRGEKYSIYGRFCSITLNKLNSAVTNYSKCMGHLACQIITANVSDFHISSDFTDCLPVKKFELVDKLIVNTVQFIQLGRWKAIIIGRQSIVTHLLFLIVSRSFQCQWLETPNQRTLNRVPGFLSALVPEDRLIYSVPYPLHDEGYDLR